MATLRTHRRRTKGQLRLLAATFVVLPLWTQSVAEIPKSSESATVWAAATFDKTGALAALNYSRLAAHSTEFLDQLRVPLTRMRIKPVIVDGEHVTFETGLRITVKISMEGRSARYSVQSVQIQPLPLKTFSPDSKSLRLGNYETVRFQVDATCRVTKEGSCLEVHVRPIGGTAPEVFVKAVKEAYRQWIFEPQKVNGQPVEGEATMGFALNFE